MLDSRITPARRPGAEPLVLLPGIGASLRNFARISDPLAERFEVVAVDLPGHSESPRLAVRPTVAAIADAVEELVVRQIRGPYRSIGGLAALLDAGLDDEDPAAGSRDQRDDERTRLPR